MLAGPPRLHSPTQSWPPPPPQVPQLYLLAVDASRMLGLTSTPRLHLLSSREAAAHYLLLPAGAGAGTGRGRAPDPATGGGAGSSAAGGRPAGLSGSGPGLPAGGGAWQPGLVLTSGLVDLLEPEELVAVMAGCLGLHAALEPEPQGAPPPSKETAAGAALARSLAALASLASLASLAPEALRRQLPQQAAPLFAGRLRPLLLRAARFLPLFTDRAALAAAGALHVVASALVKLAAGSTLLRDELSVDAVLAQAAALDDGAAAALPRLLRAEEGGSALAAAGASLTVLRIKELLRWSSGLGQGGSQAASGVAPAAPGAAAAMQQQQCALPSAAVGQTCV